MCDPVSLSITAVAIAGLGTIASTVSSINQAKYQEGVARQNAKLADDSARDAIDRGRIEMDRQQNAAAKLRGEQTAQLAASGLDVSFGSSSRVLSDSALTAATDAATIRANAGREARGYEIQGANYEAEARAAGMRATAAGVKGAFDFASTIIGGAQKLGSAKAQQSLSKQGW
jgi:hypothetical protein